MPVLTLPSTLCTHLLCVHIYFVYTFTLCTHLLCVHIYFVYTFTLRTHLLCVHIYFVYTFTLCTHLLCVHIYFVYTFTLCTHLLCVTGATPGHTGAHMTVEDAAREELGFVAEHLKVCGLVWWIWVWGLGVRG